MAIHVCECVCTLMSLGFDITCAYCCMSVLEREHCILKLVNKWCGNHCRDGPSKPRVRDPSLCHSKRSLQVTQTHTDTRSLPFNLSRGEGVRVDRGERRINKDRQH